MKSVFPMDRGEAFALLFLVAYSVISFLPVWSRVEVAGMAAFGWLMAILMVVSPALALLAFKRGGGGRKLDPRGREGDRE